MSLERYRQKRDFHHTPEPSGETAAATPDQQGHLFVMQQHAASRLHFDLRLELNGVLLSWALPKGPSLDTRDKRLAIQVEDHPLEYAEFEGVIPTGQYGAGTVQVWDRGCWTPRNDAAADYLAGELKFDLHGQKLRGGWMLKRLKEAEHWLLIKEKDDAVRHRDEYDILQTRPESVLTGRSLAEISATRPVPPGVDNVDANATRQTPIDLSDFDLARAADMPDRIRPCLPTAAGRPPRGKSWVHELKHDGYRMVCFKRGDHVEFQSRNGKRWTDRLPNLSAAIAHLPCNEVVLDGEVVMLGADGRTHFQSLQNRIGAGQDAELRYYLFDILYLDGHSLAELPLLQRKQILAQLCPSQGTLGRLLYTEHLDADGELVFDQARALGVEGIVSKRSDRPYSFGRSDDWLKTKYWHSAEFIVGGYTPESGSRIGLGALLLGLPSAPRKAAKSDPTKTEPKPLRYLGKVGSGFTHDTLASLRAQLDAMAVESSPFHDLTKRQADKGTVWVSPQLVVEVAYGGWTDDGRLRFAKFRGLRDDVAAAALPSAEGRLQDDGCTVGTKNAAAPSDDQPESATSVTAADVRPYRDIQAEPRLPLAAELSQVRLTSPRRLVFPELGISKLGLATYYAQVAPWLLPHIQGRPLSLLRCPEGVDKGCFFQKRAPQGLAESVRQIQLPSSEGNRLFLVVEELTGLMSLIQFGVVELHVSSALADRFDRPNRMIIDLDPGPGCTWPSVVAAALQLRDWLQTCGLVSFAKTSGNAGLHIVVPLRRRHGWDDVRDFARGLAARFAKRWPNQFTTDTKKSARRGKILLDVARNVRGATTVAAYSVRANSVAGVSLPVDWQQLEHTQAADQFGPQQVLSRLAKIDADPWESLTEVQQTITRQARQQLEF